MPVGEGIVKPRPNHRPLGRGQGASRPRLTALARPPPGPRTGRAGRARSRGASPPARPTRPAPPDHRAEREAVAGARGAMTTGGSPGGRSITISPAGIVANRQLRRAIAGPSAHGRKARRRLPRDRLVGPLRRSPGVVRVDRLPRVTGALDLDPRHPPAPETVGAPHGTERLQTGNRWSENGSGRRRSGTGLGCSSEANRMIRVGPGDDPIAREPSKRSSPSTRRPAPVGSRRRRPSRRRRGRRRRRPVRRGGRRSSSTPAPRGRAPRNGARSDHDGRQRCGPAHRPRDQPRPRARRVQTTPRHSSRPVARPIAGPREDPRPCSTPSPGSSRSD